MDAPVLTVLPNLVIINGIGRYTWSAGAPKIRISIPRTFLFSPPVPATMQFFTLANQPGALYVCQYVSAFYRTVRYELDKVDDLNTPLFDHYNTGSLPSGGLARNLSVISAYAEAGVEFQATGRNDVIPNTEPGADARWNNSELHDSMEKHFSQWRDTPQWSVWEVACQEHVLGTGLYGIMFDQQGSQRQGCAVFHAGIGGTIALALASLVFFPCRRLRDGIFDFLHNAAFIRKHMRMTALVASVGPRMWAFLDVVGTCAARTEDALSFACPCWSITVFMRVAPPT